MRLSDDSIALLTAAFLSRAQQHDGATLLYLKRRNEFAPEFKKVLGIALTQEESDVLLESLIKVGVFSEVSDRFTKGFIHVVGNVRQIEEQEAKREGTPYYYANRLGREWLDEALGSFEFVSELSDPDLELVSPLAPAADRLVTLNHNSAELHKVVQLTQNAHEIVRGANSLDVEKASWIKSHILLGLELLKGKKVILGAVSALLLKPLIAAYEAVAEESAKQAILSAMNAIRQFFGI